MKLSYASLALVLFSGAIAAPSSLEQRDDPPNDPIHLNHALPLGDTVTCGGNSYTESQIYDSVQYAVNLQLAGQTRGSRFTPFLASPFPYPATENRQRERLMKAAHTQKPNIPTPSRTMTARATSWYFPPTAPLTPTAWSIRY